jgi:hypothetical protein
MVTYGVGNWAWTKADVSRLMAAQIRFLKSVQKKENKKKK